jgi:hypothetical protein
MKILFHDNSLCLFGTTVALYDYAYYCREMFNVQVSIIYHSKHWANNQKVIEMFVQEFGDVRSYDEVSDLQTHIDEIKPDVFFAVKGGRWDGVISKSCKNWTLAVNPNAKEIYGDRFAVASKWLSKATGIENIVPHMVNLPDVDGNLREELNIPTEAIVFGRNGGADTFDLEFVKKAVIDIVNSRTDIYFLFQGTNKFIDHPRVIHLPQSPSRTEKVRFINTTDALLHARFQGESFGLTCAEFSSKNKPVITWLNSQEKSHIEILGDKGIYYTNYEDIFRILNEFRPNSLIDWNCYRDYLPKPVMDRFHKIYFE